MARMQIREGLVPRLKEARNIPSDEVMARMIGVDRGTLRRVVAGDQPSGSFMAGFVLAFGLGVGEAFEVVQDKAVA